MADIEITLPNPAEILAPPPMQKGTVHEYYYTGEVTKPVWYDGRPLWDAMFVYGWQKTTVGRTVESRVLELLLAGQAIINLPICTGCEVYTVDAVITPNYSEDTITFPPAVVTAIDISAPVQIGRYCLYPIGKISATKIKFHNMPSSGLPSVQTTIAQGDGKYKILARKPDTEPARVHVVNNRRCRIENLSFKEVQ